MKNWFSKLLADTNEQGRNIFVIALITFGVSILSTPLYIYLAVQARSWQIYAMLGMIASFMLASLYSAVLARKNRTDPALAWILGGFFAIVPLLAAVISGMGLVLAIAQTLGTFLIAGQTLKGPRATRVAIGGIAMAVITVLIDQFAPWERASYPLLSASIPYISGAAILTLGAYALREYRQYSLRTKLIGGFLIVTLIPLGVTFILNNRNTRQTLTNDANTALSSAAAAAAANVDDFLAGRLTDVRNAAQLHILEEYLALPPAERLGSETETVLYRDFRAIASRDTIYITSVGLIDARGTDIADTYSADVGLDKATREWFTQPVERGLPYVSPLEFSEALGQYSLYFSAPVRNADGEIIGVLRIRYNADVLQEIVVESTKKAGFQESGIDLFDENHIVLAVTDHPDEFLKMVVPLPADKLAQLQAARRLPEGSAESLSFNNPELEQRLNNASQQPNFTLESENEQAAVVAIKNQPWILLFSQNRDFFLAPLAVQTRASALLATVIAALVAAAGFFVAQTLSAPIVRLTAVAEQVAAGDNNVQAKVESSDEIGTLAGAFNTMTAKLREFIASLEQRVADRTKDLEAAQAVMARRATELQSVAEISTKASATTNILEMLQNLVEFTKSSFNLYHAHVYLLDDNKTKLTLTTGAGEVGAQMVSEKRVIPFDHPNSLVARAARTAEGAISNDVTQEPDFLPNPLLPDTSSEMAIPIVAGDTVLGVFDVQADVVNRFTDEDIAVMTTLARQIAVSLQNARSFSQSQRQTDREIAVNLITQKIQGTTTIEAALQMTARELGHALGMKQTLVTLEPNASAGDGKSNQ